MTEVEYSVLIQRLNQFEKRLSVLEGIDKNSLSSELYLEIELPEADIDGLHFTRQYVKSLFVLKDGNYYAKDVLFHSARNTTDNSSRDILTEYLESDEVKEAFATAYNEAIESNEIDADDIKVFLPSKEYTGNHEIKKYNGGREWYWLKEKYSTTYFVYVDSIGYVSGSNAYNMYGVSPAFCIVKDNA